MASSSESSDDTGGTSSSGLKGAACWQRCCRWRPGWYTAVFVVNATAAALLFPVEDADAQYRSDGIWVEGYRLCFGGVTLASLGCGWGAAFLIKRAGASAHIRSASRYAVINWFQSILASMVFLPQGLTYGPFGVSSSGHFQFCRVLLYLIACVWMQKLIASRIHLLEQSSSENYCARSVRRLVHAQAWCAGLCAGGTTISWYFDWIGSVLPILWSLCFWCNVVANVVAACSLSKSLAHLWRILQMAELKDTSLSVRSALRRARSLAFLQVMGVCLSLVLTTLGFPCIFLTLYIKLWKRNWEFSFAAVSVMAFDLFGNALAVLLLSGSHRLPKVEGMNGHLCPLCPEVPRVGCCRKTKPVATKNVDWSPAWTSKVEELSLRGMTLRSLLDFYQWNLALAPDWTYVPKAHKTRDVVRRVIIPLTSREESAYSVSTWNRDGAQRAQVMVTHNWGNTFIDLLAAALSDALEECSFKMVAQLLEEDATFLSEMLGKVGRLDQTYWICAFAVNQHISICHSNPYDHDPVTNLLHPVCGCSSVNISDPDGRSTASEINKFDDMMYHLATTGVCRQVIAVDKSLDLFHRAWCVAEIAEANRLRMAQSLKLVSKGTLQQRAGTLENLDVRSMKASCERDKELILGKIESIEEFNLELKALIFDPNSGLLASWHAMDTLQQVAEVGRLIRWGLADGGTGKVWRAWEIHD